MTDAANGGKAFASSQAGENSASRAFDDDSSTAWESQEADAHIEYVFAREIPQRITLYTLTSTAGPASTAPRDWELRARERGGAWQSVDSRSNESFRWNWQTRVFAVQRPMSAAAYRLRILGNAGATTTQIAEIELYAEPASALEKGKAGPAASRSRAWRPFDVKARGCSVSVVAKAQSGAVVAIWFAAVIGFRTRRACRGAPARPEGQR